MTMKTLPLLTLLVMLFTTSAWALPSPQDVGKAVEAGNYAEAESMAKEVLTSKPDSAKAHYLLGEVYNREQKYEDAYQQFIQASNLDKTLSFASSTEKFRDEIRKAEVNTDRVQAPRATSAAEPSHLGQYIYIIFWCFGLGFFVIFLIMSLTNKKEKKAAADARDAERVTQSEGIQNALNNASDLEVALKLANLSETTKATRLKLLADIKRELTGYLVSNKQDNKLIAYGTINSVRFRLKALEDNMTNEAMP
jgi:tetratricopeptide (TPR) repeat protein